MGGTPDQTPSMLNTWYGLAGSISAPHLPQSL